jgi:hypothetical protein
MDAILARGAELLNEQGAGTQLQQHTRLAAQKERFSTEWALGVREEHECEQESPQSGDAPHGGWALVSPLEAIGRPACGSARLER